MCKLKYSHPDTSVLLDLPFINDSDWRFCMSSMAICVDLVLCFVLSEAWHGVILQSVLFEVNMADLALRKMSSGGGTGSTTGTELSECLLRRTTSIGPLMLFMWIWYFAGLFWTWKYKSSYWNHPFLIKEKQKEETTVGSTDAGLTALGMGTSNCVPDGACTAKRVWPEERGEIFGQKSTI